MISTLLNLRGKMYTRQTVVIYPTGRFVSNEGSCGGSMLKLWFACKDVIGVEVMYNLFKKRVQACWLTCSIFLVI
jgi:hypothetical protein